MEANKLLTTSNGQQVLNETKIDNHLVVFTQSLKDFLNWWYVKMPLWHIRMLVRISTFIDDNTSISLLIRNFFLPWHRDYSAIGYTFGIIMKLLYLPLAIFAYLIGISIYLAIILIWLLLPPATIFFIFRSILTI